MNKAVAVQSVYVSLALARLLLTMTTLLAATVVSYVLDATMAYFSLLKKT